MEKEFFNENLGGDGGKVVGGIDKGNLALDLRFPVLKVVQPAAEFLKKLIPGDKYDSYVDDIVSAGLKLIGIAVPAPAPTPAPTAPQP